MLMGLAIGSSVVITRLGIVEVPVLSLVMLRLATATLAFAIVMVVLGREVPRRARTRFDIALGGLMNMGIPLIAFTEALRFVSSGVVSVFLALIPLVTGLAAHVWLTHERLSKIQLLGLVVGLGGVVLLLLTRTAGLAVLTEQVDIRGHLLALGGALSASFAVVYTRARLRDTDVLTVAAGQTLCGLLAVAPVALLLDNLDLGEIGWRGWLSVVYSGLIGSFVAFLLFFYMLKRFGAVTAALPGYVVPVVAVALGALLLGEVVTGILLVSASLTLIGVFLASRTQTRTAT